jgi:type IV pilus modification protein PilV
VTKRLDALRHESGFTIIEVMVAALLLVIGVLAVTTMINNANAVTNTTRAREGATNLTRQLLEVARTQQYSRVDNSNLNTLLQAAGIPDDDTGTNGWQVRRRKVTFTVTSHSCIFDAAKDGARSQAADQAATYCPGSATAGSSPTDNAPDDYRRVEFTVTWSFNGRPPDCNGQTTGAGSGANISTGIGRACVTQSELIPNPTGGLGPDVQSIDYDHSCCTVGTGTDDGAIEQNTGAQMVFTVKTSSPADQVLWRADDTVSSGSATADPADTTFKTWHFTYTYPTNPPLVDGPHTLTLQAFLASVSGTPRPYVFTLNRNVPPSPNTQFNAQGTGASMSPVGVNTRLSGTTVGNKPIVEVNWNQVPDGDIVGYTAYKTVQPSPLPVLTVPLDAVGCPTGGSTTLTGSTETSCVDTDPPAISGGALTPNPISYYIVAFDNAWTVRASPIVYSAAPLPGQAECGLLTSPINVSPGAFTPLRPGCPSAVTSIDINQLAQKARPTLAGIINKGSSNGLTTLDWPDGTEVNSSTPIQFYRVYRNPGSLTQPAVADRYSRSGTSSFIDPSPSATCDTYAVTAVDSNWQESDPISVGCP